MISLQDELASIQPLTAHIYPTACQSTVQVSSAGVYPNTNRAKAENTPWTVDQTGTRGARTRIHARTQAHARARAGIHARPRAHAYMHAQISNEFALVIGTENRPGGEHELAA